MRQVALWTLISSITLVAPAAVTPSFGQSSAVSDVCLSIQDSSGPLPDGGTLCQVATSGHKCTFNLDLCVNQADGTCVPATFNPEKAIHATGHCGPVRKLQVTPSGTTAVCGQSAPITVRTRGTHMGQCTISARARTAKTHTHKAVRKLTLMCQPPSGTCPSTTTTISTTSTTTTTR